MSRVRFLGSACVGAVLTLVVFYFMFTLIAHAETRPDPEENIPSISFTSVKPPPPPTVKNRQPPPEKPKPVKTPQQPKPDVVEKPRVDQFIVDIDVPELWPGIDQIAYTTEFPSGGGTGADGDLVRLVYVSPNFPPEAAISGTEGWVRVAFTVGPDGLVSSPKVVEAFPSSVFNRAAIRAVLKWKFKPYVVDGQARPRQVVQQIDFNLPDA